MATTESTALFTTDIDSGKFLDTLERVIVLPRLVMRDAEADFAGSVGRTVDFRKPQIRTASSVNVGPRNIAGAGAGGGTGVGGPLNVGGTIPTLTLVGGIETYIPITLDTRVYDRQPLSDYAATVDLLNRDEQIVSPMIRAVARGLEDKIATLMSGATYAATKTIKGLTAATAPTTDANAFLDLLIDMSVDLDIIDVPRTDRVFLAGSQFMRGVLRALGRRGNDNAVTFDALTDATVAHVGGFDIVGSNAIASTAAYAFHKSAYMAAFRAPAVSGGVISGQSISSDGLAMTLIQDYISDTSQESVLISTFCGTAVNTEPGQSGAGNPGGAPVFKRSIKVTVDMA